MPLKRTFWQIERFVVYRILHADDTPHRLALGIALGFFIGWTPTVGLQMILVVLTASLLRVNRVVGLPIVWISNPFTIVPIFVSNYWLGAFLIGLFSQRPAANYQQIKDALTDLTGPGHQFLELRFWQSMGRVFVDISMELWLGSIIMGLLLGLISYIVSYKAIVWYRANPPRMLRRARLRDRTKQIRKP